MKVEKKLTSVHVLEDVYRKFNFHSIEQVVVGAIVGSAFGYLVYQLAREKIKGRIKERTDDFGPI
jgi:hypothetical protein